MRRLISRMHPAPAVKTTAGTSWKVLSVMAVPPAIPKVWSCRPRYTIILKDALSPAVRFTGASNIRCCAAFTFMPIFADGNLWGLKRNGSEWQSALLLDTAPSSIITFGDGEDGNIYLADHAAGSHLSGKNESQRAEPPVCPMDRWKKPYHTTLRAGGGQPPYVWSISAGSLPDGSGFGFQHGQHQWPSRGIRAQHIYS